jgi:hypothetical protein
MQGVNLNPRTRPDFMKLSIANLPSIEFASVDMGQAFTLTKRAIDFIQEAPHTLVSFGQSLQK